MKARIMQLVDRRPKLVFWTLTALVCIGLFVAAKYQIGGSTPPDCTQVRCD